MVHPKITRHHFAKLALGLCAVATTLMVGLSFGGRIPEPLQRMMGGASKAKVATSNPQSTPATTASRTPMSVFPSAVGNKGASVENAVADATRKSAPQSSGFSQGASGHRSGGAVASSSEGTLSIATRRLPIAVAGQSYSATLSSANSTGLDTWTAQGLPTGLSLNAQTGVISGTVPQASAGIFEIEVSVTDELEVDSTQLALTVLSGANIAAAAPSSGGLDVEKVRREIATPEASIITEASTHENGYQPASVATALYPPPLFSLMGISPSSSSPVFVTSSIVTSAGSFDGAGVEVPGQEVSDVSNSIIHAGVTISTLTSMIESSREEPESTEDPAPVVDDGE